MIADKFEAEAQHKTIPTGTVPVGWRALDIGPETVKAYGKVIANAALVIWNGPMGVFEFPAFAEGTFKIAKVISESNAVSVIGGGDSVAAIQQSGLTDKITHNFHRRRSLPGNARGSHFTRPGCPPGSLAHGLSGQSEPSG